MSTAPQNTNEQLVWEGRPSQWNNAGAFFAAGLFFWLVFPVLIALWKWLVIKNTRYVLTDQRLFTYRGVLNKHTDELELYRIKDYAQFKPLLMRMVGLGIVTLITSDRTTPTVSLKGILEADKVQGMIRDQTEASRIRRGVREIDA
jgi:uncharacterized membrane protein YdbT with pleckstrin-like domain